ncbi:MAG: hypothetical protein LBU58_03485, partial [Clostridiales bacterium]|nr:hypothetical protein [Clostridiales bacterium]
MDNIAIVGMGCLFPDYADKEKFWDRLIKGETFLSRDSFMGKPIERSGLPRSGSEAFFRGRLSDQEIEEFDRLGELFKWVAYVTDEALKESGAAGDAGKLKRTGMVMGSVAMTMKDQLDAMYPFLTATVGKEVNTILSGYAAESADGRFRHTFVRQSENLKPESLLADTEAARLVAEKRGLGGPVVMFNAACASPLYALKLASMYLNSGEADMMIAGSHCSNETVAGICGLFDIFGVLCGVGESVPLDKNTKGLITGSGAGVFALKRLSDAEAEGDKILAVIENIGWSNDGGMGAGVMAPAAEGQLAAYRSAYSGGLSKELDYIECHATGTIVGDQTEIESINRFFGEGARRPLLGALKGSTGHFFTATANASIAKLIFAMEHEVIPATVGVKDPLCDRIVLTNTPWKRGKKPRRAGVNAFGFGGINAHLVLREYQKARPQSGLAKAKPQSSLAVAGTQNAAATSPDEIAIVGMGLHIGGFDTVESFMKGLTLSKKAFTKPDKDRWRGFETDADYLSALGFRKMPEGAYINSVNFDFMRYKMPLKGDPYFLRKDMLMLDVAAEAIDDAGIVKGLSPNTAVIVHSAPDYTDQLFMASVELNDSLVKSLEDTCPDLTAAQRDEIVKILREDEEARENSDNVQGIVTNIRGNRISAHWGFAGPSFTLFDRENSIFRCLEVARFFLNEGIADNVVVGVSSLSGELEHLYTQKELGAMELLLERGVAEGAVALVIKRKEKALT